ncbi:MAG TPA: hypothetical protein VE152_12030, partial [Acidimicrobiales bacterium]|nr:hypothetical protein [Acidimicrobiales bacterium]
GSSGGGATGHQMAGAALLEEVTVARLVCRQAMLGHVGPRAACPAGSRVLRGRRSLPVRI